MAFTRRCIAIATATAAIPTRLHTATAVSVAVVLTHGRFARLTREILETVAPALDTLTVAAAVHLAA